MDGSRNDGGWPLFVSRFSSRTWIGIGISIVTLALATWGAVSGFRSKDKSLIALQGNVDVRQVNLSFKVAGSIAEMLVDEGGGLALSAQDGVGAESNVGVFRA